MTSLCILFRRRFHTVHGNCFAYRMLVIILYIIEDSVWLNIVCCHSVNYVWYRYFAVLINCELWLSTSYFHNACGIVLFTLPLLMLGIYCN